MNNVSLIENLVLFPKKILHNFSKMQAHIQWAEMYHKTGNFEKARKHKLRAQELDPNAFGTSILSRIYQELFPISRSSAVGDMKKRNSSTKNNGEKEQTNIKQKRYEERESIIKTTRKIKKVIHCASMQLCTFPDEHKISSGDDEADANISSAKELELVHSVLYYIKQTKANSDKFVTDGYKKREDVPSHLCIIKTIEEIRTQLDGFRNSLMKQELQIQKEWRKSSSRQKKQKIQFEQIYDREEEIKERNEIREYIHEMMGAMRQVIFSPYNKSVESVRIPTKYKTANLKISTDQEIIEVKYVLFWIKDNKKNSDNYVDDVWVKRQDISDHNIEKIKQIRTALDEFTKIMNEQIKRIENEKTKLNFKILFSN